MLSISQSIKSSSLVASLPSDNVLAFIFSAAIATSHASHPYASLYFILSITAFTGARLFTLAILA